MCHGNCGQYEDTHIHTHQHTPTPETLVTLVCLSRFQLDLLHYQQIVRCGKHYRAHLGFCRDGRCVLLCSSAVFLGYGYLSFFVVLSLLFVLKELGPFVYFCPRFCFLLLPSLFFFSLSLSLFLSFSLSLILFFSLPVRCARGRGLMFTLARVLV